MRFAAPDADDQIHRDQAAFEEDVEEQQVLRGEGADHQDLGGEHRRHIFGHALLDRDPARTDADRHEEDREHDQQQREAVDAQRPGEIDAADAEQAGMLDELPLGSTRALIEIGPEPDAERQIDQGRGQCDPAGALCARQQAGDRGDRGHCQHDGEDRETGHPAITQVSAAVRPISMMKA